MPTHTKNVAPSFRIFRPVHRPSSQCLEHRGKNSFYQSLFFGMNFGTTFVGKFPFGHRYR
ncbi:hypothetical protein DIE23_01420 [Burkholderia sp. Bp9143]|nr:hypothetical protein DIE23_01420 [Burkholderia sp. Bp9143]